MRKVPPEMPFLHSSVPYASYATETFTLVRPGFLPSLNLFYLMVTEIWLPSKTTDMKTIHVHTQVEGAW